MGLRASVFSILSHGPSFNSQTFRRLLSFRSTDNQSQGLLDLASPSQPRPSAMGRMAFLFSTLSHGPSFNSQTFRRLLSFGSTDNQSEGLLDLASPSQSRPSAMGLAAFLFSTLSNSQTFRRLLSFGSTDNQTEGLLDLASPSQPQPQPQSFQPADSIALRSLELAVNSTATESSDDATTPQQDSKRVGKLAQPVALFLGAMSFGLILSPLPSVQSHILLVTAHTVFVYLSLFLGVGLCIYSILKPTSIEVARVQMTLMVIGLVSIALAFVLRTCILLPIAFLKVAWLLFFLAMALVLLCIVVAWKHEGYIQTAQAPDHAV